MKEVLIIGGANPTIIRTIEDLNTIEGEKIEIVGVIDNTLAKGTKVLGKEVLGGFEVLSKFDLHVAFVNSIASNTKIRKETTEFLLSTGRRTMNVIHPSVNIEYV